MAYSSTDKSIGSYVLIEEQEEGKERLPLNDMEE